jgi:hypothetical protein
VDRAHARHRGHDRAALLGRAAGKQRRDHRGRGRDASGARGAGRRRQGCVRRPRRPASTRTIDARALPASITLPRGRAETDALAATAAGSTAATSAPAPLVDPPLPPPVVVAQAPARAAPDRWQRLAEQIESCPSDTLKRAVCQESLRIEYCEGNWGRVAACPAKVEREYGN